LFQLLHRMTGLVDIMARMKDQVSVGFTGAAPRRAA
jgi:hypothetical protein